MEEKSALPVILCLHGYGTNAFIFRYQLRHVMASLSNTFRFIIPDAPFLVDAPGPGATSVDSGPFRRWQSEKGIASFFGMSDEQLREEALTVRELLHSVIAAEGPVVGLLAFSQGACLGSALCMDGQLGSEIKFGVFVCALFPAVDLGQESAVEERRKIEIPCIHVRGSADPYGAQGLKLFERHFSGEAARRVIDFKGRHEVPSRQDDVHKLSESIMEIWTDLEVNKGD